MPSIILTPTAASNSGGTWSGLEFPLIDDGNVASLQASALDTTMFVKNFSAGIPTDVSITGIKVAIKSSYTGTPTGSAGFNVFLSSNALSACGMTRSITGLSSALTTLTTGGSGELWGVVWKRSHIHGNVDFSVGVYRTSTTDVTLNVDVVYIEIYFEYSQWLVGQRSRYPGSLDFVKNSANTNGGNIPRQRNGSGPEHQIKSEDVNLLGDCLYSIQNYIITENANSSVVRALGLPPQGLATNCLTCTITGTLASPAVVNWHLNQLLTAPSSYTNTSTGNLTSVKKNITGNPINPNGSAGNLVHTDLFFPFVSAIGWVNIGATKQAIHVSPRVICQKNRANSLYTTIIGFTAVARSIANNVTFSTAGGYNGSYVAPAPVPAGIVVVKISAFSQPYPYDRG
jgi:hypothetical protein